MAKPRGDSKLAVAGALTLVLAIAGVLLVKEPCAVHGRWAAAWR